MASNNLAPGYEGMPDDCFALYISDEEDISQSDNTLYLILEVNDYPKVKGITNLFP
jgi:hypothetical protein